MAETKTNGHNEAAENPDNMDRVSILLYKDHIARLQAEAKQKGLKLSALIRTKLMELEAAGQEKPQW